MEHLWSPWRMEYIADAAQDRPGACVFCDIVEGHAAGAEDRMLARTDHAFATLAKYPYNPGHVLVLPVRHTGDLETLTAEEMRDIGALMQRAVTAIREDMEPHGFNCGLNLGRVAGAGIPEHLHWHVVPRWGGDTNFMPITGQTRVLPELLADTHRRLAPRFR